MIAGVAPNMKFVTRHGGLERDRQVPSLKRDQVLSTDH